MPATARRDPLTQAVFAHLSALQHAHQTISTAFQTLVLLLHVLVLWFAAGFPRHSPFQKIAFTPEAVIVVWTLVISCPLYSFIVSGVNIYKHYRNLALVRANSTELLGRQNSFQVLVAAHLNILNLLVFGPFVLGFVLTRALVPESAFSSVVSDTNVSVYYWLIPPAILSLLGCIVDWAFVHSSFISPGLLASSSPINLILVWFNLLVTLLVNSMTVSRNNDVPAEGQQRFSPSFILLSVAAKAITPLLAVLVNHTSLVFYHKWGYQVFQSLHGGSLLWLVYSLTALSPQMRTWENSLAECLPIVAFFWLRLTHTLDPKRRVQIINAKSVTLRDILLAILRLSQEEDKFESLVYFGYMQLAVERYSAHGNSRSFVGFVDESSNAHSSNRLELKESDSHEQKEFEVRKSRPRLIAYLFETIRGRTGELDARSMIHYMWFMAEMGFNLHYLSLVQHRLKASTLSLIQRFMLHTVEDNLSSKLSDLYHGRISPGMLANADTPHELLKGQKPKPKAATTGDQTDDLNPKMQETQVTPSGLDLNLFFSYSSLFETLGKQLRQATKAAMEFYDEVSLKSYDIGKLHHIARRVDREKQDAETIFKLIEEKTEETQSGHLIPFAKTLDVLYGDKLKARKMVAKCDLRISLSQHNTAIRSEANHKSLKDWTSVLYSLDPNTLGVISQISKNSDENLLQPPALLEGSNLNDWQTPGFRPVHKQLMQGFLKSVDFKYLGAEKPRIVSLDRESFVRVVSCTKIHTDISKGIMAATILKRTCKNSPMLVLNGEGKLLGANPEGAQLHSLLTTNKKDLALGEVSTRCFEASQILMLNFILKHRRQLLIDVLDQMGPDNLESKVAYLEVSAGQRIALDLLSNLPEHKNKPKIESAVEVTTEMFKWSPSRDQLKSQDTKSSLEAQKGAARTTHSQAESKLASSIYNILTKYPISKIKQSLQKIDSRQTMNGLSLTIPKQVLTRLESDENQKYVDLKKTSQLFSFRPDAKLPASMELLMNVCGGETYQMYLLTVADNSHEGVQDVDVSSGSQSNESTGRLNTSPPKSGNLVHKSLHRNSGKLRGSEINGAPSKRTIPLDQPTSNFEYGYEFEKTETLGVKESAKEVPGTSSIGSRVMRSVHSAFSRNKTKTGPLNKIHTKEPQKRVLRQPVEANKARAEARIASKLLDNNEEGSSISSRAPDLVARARTTKKTAFRFVWATLSLLICTQIVFWIGTVAVRYQMGLSLDSEIKRLIDKRYSILNWLSTDSARRYTVINVMQELLQRKGLMNFTNRYRNITTVEEYKPVVMLEQMTNVTVYFWNGLMQYMQTFKPEDVHRLSTFTSQITINRNELSRTDRSTSFTYKMASMDMFKMSLGITDSYQRLFRGELPAEGTVPALDLNSSKLETVEWLNTNEFLANMTVKFVSSLLTTDETTYLELVKYVKDLMLIYYAVALVCVLLVLFCCYLLRRRIGQIYKVYAKIRDPEVQYCRRGIYELENLVEGMVNLRSEYPKAANFNLKLTPINMWDIPQVNDLVVLKTQLNRRYVAPVLGSYGERKIRYIGHSGHLGSSTWFGIGIFVGGLILALVGISASFYVVFTATSTQNKYELTVMFVNRSVGRILFTGTAMILKVYVSMLARAGLRKSVSQVSVDLVGYTNLLTNFDDNLKMATAFFNQNSPEVLEKAGFSLLTQPPCPTLGARLLPVTLAQCEQLAAGTMKIDWITTYRWLSLYFQSLLDKLKRTTAVDALSVLDDPTFIGVEALYHGMLDYLPAYTYNFYRLLYGFHSEATWNVRVLLVRLIWAVGSLITAFNIWRLSRLKGSIRVAVHSLNLIPVDCVLGNSHLKAQVARVKLL